MRKKTSLLYCILITAVFLWCGGIVAAPLLEYAGYNTGSAFLYKLYGKVCHQKASHSFSIEGKQFAVCIRCTSLYYGFAIGTVLFLLTRHFGGVKFSPSFLLLCIPATVMLADVGLNFFQIHSSTITSRMITGISVGTLLPWYVYPVLIEALVQLNKQRKQSHGTTTIS